MGTIKVYRFCFASIDDYKLSESIFDKLELYDLKLALGRQIKTYIELTFDEYSLINKMLFMERIRIKVTDYYGNPSYYSVMPQALFDLLESATLNGEEWISVDKDQFDKMIYDYKLKMEQ